MKGSHWFMVVILLFLGIMFAVEYNLPKKFVWSPTFSSHDYQPFGCAIFDSVVGNTWMDDYYTTSWTLYNMDNDTTGEPLSIVVIAEDLQLTKTDQRAVLRLVERGNKVMLVANSFSLSDTLGYNLSSDEFSSKKLKEYASSAFSKRDTLYWLTPHNAGKESHPPRKYVFYPHLCSTYFTKWDSTFVPLVSTRVDTIKMQQDSLPDCFPPVVVRRQLGKGKLLLVTNPLLFTNYGMLDGDNATYLFRLLNELGGLPLYRITAYNEAGEEPQSPLRYFLSQPPLRWGIYLTIFALILFMIFTARRRQRPIPIVRQPANKTLEFTELIGTLYFQKKNHGDLVRKKFTYFAETLRRTVQVDVEDENDDVALSHRLAGKTGLEADWIRNLLYELRPIVRGDREAREAEMKEWIDRMNEILKRC